MALDFRLAGVGAGSGRWGMLLRSCPPEPACGQLLLLYFAPQHAPPARSSEAWGPFAVEEHLGMQPRESGGQRSEVKGEGWAQPVPEDMSGVAHPAPSARAARQGESH